MTSMSEAMRCDVGVPVANNLVVNMGPFQRK